MQLPAFEPLRESIKVGVLIIGGGLAGLLCAHRLAQDGMDYALVEADTIYSGITKNTTAKITSQYGLIYDSLLRKWGMEKARLYLKANQHVLQQYRELCQDIHCDFEEQDALVYALNDWQKLDRELEALHKLDFEADLQQELSLPFPVAGAARFLH